MKIYKISWFLILFFILFLSSGCSLKVNQSKLIDENSRLGSRDAFNEAEVIGRIVQLKKGLTPLVKPDDKKKSGQAANQNEEPQVQLENLAETFKQALIKTNLGDIKVEFFSQESPISVNNFLNLAKVHFYDGTTFHRVIKDFMIQGGDPLSKDNNPANDGQGGPGYQFQDEINSHKLVKGSLAMANSGPNTNGSQFFIVTADSTAHLDGKHTNFGYVVAGLDVVEKIAAVETDENDRPVVAVIISSVELIKE